VPALSRKQRDCPNRLSSPASAGRRAA
jgi:hypothetical protein